MKYRRLKNGEVIRAGDEVYGRRHQSWILTEMSGERVGWDEDCGRPILKYRRPIKAVAARSASANKRSHATPKRRSRRVR